jgi:hypothetical protein
MSIYNVWIKTGKSTWAEIEARGIALPAARQAVAGQRVRYSAIKP